MIKSLLTKTFFSFLCHSSEFKLGDFNEEFSFLKDKVG